MIKLVMAFIFLILSLAAGCAAPATKSVSLQLRVASEDPKPGYKLTPMADPKRRVYLSPTVELTEMDVKSARAMPLGPGYVVGVEMTRSGRGKLADVTREHPKDMLAIIINGKVILALPIISEITDGRMLLAGNFTKPQAERLAEQLNGGPAKK